MNTLFYMLKLICDRRQRDKLSKPECENYKNCNKLKQKEKIRLH